jgi:hypothetical protein
MSEDALQQWFEALAERAETPVIGQDEADAVLDLTRVVAHSSERRFAPLTAYVAGLAFAQMDERQREARLRTLIRQAQSVARSSAESPEDGGGA